jgi:hypothetical protein
VRAGITLISLVMSDDFDVLAADPDAACTAGTCDAWKVVGHIRVPEVEWVQ